MTQDRPKIHPKWILITLLSRWGWKNASTLLRRQFFHGIYSVFCTSHIPKAACNIAPKIQKLSSHAGKTRFFKRTHPGKHAQEAISLVGVEKMLLHCSEGFTVVRVFLHITHPKGCRQHSTKNSKIELPCKKNGLRQTQHSPPRPQNTNAPASRQRTSSFRSLCWCKKNVLVLAHLARNSRIWPYSPPRSQHSPPSGPIRLHMTPDRPNIALKWPNMATWAKISPTYSPPTDPICCRAEHRPEVAQYKPNKIVNCQTKPPTWPWNDAG